MEHLINCHGEWNALFALITSIPFMGTYIKLKLGGNNVYSDTQQQQ
jgi:hypothetical protein